LSSEKFRKEVGLGIHEDIDAAVASGDRDRLALLLERRDQLIEEHARLNSEAEQPILRDLEAVGERVSSVWDFVNTARPYPEALPVLLRHFQLGGYPDRVMESLGRALAVKPSVQWWAVLVDRYLNARSNGERTGAGVAMAACVTKAQFDEFAKLAALDLDDPSRIRGIFLKPLVRIDRERGWDVVSSLVDDPVSGVQARLMLKQKAKREAKSATGD
jgi:hypothetical protein